MKAIMKFSRLSIRCATTRASIFWPCIATLCSPDCCNETILSTTVSQSTAPPSNFCALNPSFSSKKYFDSNAVRTVVTKDKTEKNPYTVNKRRYVITKTFQYEAVAKGCINHKKASSVFENSYFKQR